MKRITTLLLVFVLLTGLCACGKEKAPPDPLLGKWEVKSADYEGVFEFRTEGEKLLGTWYYYDYANETWGNFSFTVKERTDHSLVLLIEDGTIDEMNYHIVDDHLYLDGTLYTNALAEVPTWESVDSFGLLVNGQNYEVCEGVFMGMHADDVSKATPWPLVLSPGKIPSQSMEYKYIFYCDYTAACTTSGDFYHQDFGFDQNKRLVHHTGQGHYELSAVSKCLNSISDIFGQPQIEETDLTDARWKEYIWETDRFTIILRLSTDKGEEEPSCYTLTYYYSPDNTQNS